MDFLKLKNAVATQFAAMVAADVPMFRTAIERDDMWATYLGSFPEGSNPMYRTRTEYDCSCCRGFVKNVGNVVAVINGEIVSIWDIKTKDVDANFVVVANAMSAAVKSFKIGDVFLSMENHAGAEKTFEQVVGKDVVEWNHFHVKIPGKFVMAKDRIPSALGEKRSARDVFDRALREIPVDVIDTVLELISQNSLYRGEEHKSTLSKFKSIKLEFEASKSKETFAWVKSQTVSGALVGIRNSVIGSLLTDLAEGKSLEAAVGSFEAKVAPTNYKRPTALVTKAMVDKAKATIEELGLTSALERRYANVDDIAINNLLFANRDVKKALGGDVFDDIASNVKPTAKSFDKIETVSIDKFISDVLPTAKAVELYVENRFQPNFMSLVAPVDPNAGSLLKWGNNFSWSYVGEVADSIKERVKSAGGNVTGEFCNRLAWFNHDDLDFHMTEPDGNTVYFATRSSRSACGGQLDVDMNAGQGTTRTPVENIVYQQISKMKEGTYKLLVHQYSKRETTNVGFVVETDIMGVTHTFEYDKAVASGDKILVATFKYSKAKGIELVSSLPSTTTSKDVWGVKTNSFVPVSVVMLSPNHWDEQVVGNKHFFFMLDGCLNDEQARGFYNEFLRSDLDQHRKVIEIVGSKMKTDLSERQLSGLGFSSTQKNDVVLKVNGAFERTIRVTF